MQLLANVNFDFMKWKKLLFTISATASLAGLAVFLAMYFAGGLNVGIDFKGGTEIQVKFAKPVGVAQVRSALDGAGLTGASVTTIGTAADNEIYIRLPLQESETQTLLEKVKDALGGITGRTATPPGFIDLNVADEKTVTDFVAEAGTFAREEAATAAQAISEYKRARGGIVRETGEIASLTGVNPQILSWLSGKVTLAPFSIRSQNSVEGAVSHELARKAFYAVLGSLVIMLIYIWARFRFQWGLGAVLALVHDVLVTMGIFCLFQKEWSIPVVAAFLTLVGYSVNDTIVVFDRIRENLKRKPGAKLEELINASINQTLSRTVITSGLTWMVVAALLALGGEVLNGFSFVLTIGIIIGTYSSIFIASPIIIYWETLFGSKPAAAKAKARA